MFKIKPETEVRAIVIQVPSTNKIFDRSGIDFCCSGKQTLEEACAEAGLNTDQVMQQLISVQNTELPFSPQHWEHMPLAILCNHIVRQHHQFTRNELERLGSMLDKVTVKHRESHPELVAIRSVFASLSTEMHRHMQKEEQILFPYIEALEKSNDSGIAPPQPSFMTIDQPIHTLMMGHDEAGDLLRQLCSLSHGYQAPQDACPTYLKTFQGLVEFEADLHQHMHLENNILFPRAKELENMVFQTV